MVKVSGRGNGFRLIIAKHWKAQTRSELAGSHELKTRGRVHVQDLQPPYGDNAKFPKGATP